MVTGGGVWASIGFATNPSTQWCIQGSFGYPIHLLGIGYNSSTIALMSINSDGYTLKVAFPGATYNDYLAYDLAAFIWAIG